MTPTVCLVCKSTAALGCTPQALAAALDEYVRLHVARHWPVACALRVGDPAAREWPLYVLDDADQAQALGYHTDTDGLPRGYVFARDALAGGQAVSEVAGHELGEMLCDPGTCLGALSPRGRWVALEPWDPVQGPSFPVQGLAMPDFATPAWFGAPDGGGGAFDHLDQCKQAWQLLPGGYVPVWGESGWTQIFGSAAAWQRVSKGRNALRRPERRRLRRPHAAPAGPETRLV